MWLINSSIGRKVVMSVTGIALILFLTFHCCMNIVALFSGHAYNTICELLGANWYAVAATLALAALAVIHIVYAFILTAQNRRARGDNRYEVSTTVNAGKVEWASKNMLVLGLIIVLGLLLHLWNFWYNMMFAELFPCLHNDPAPADGFGKIVTTFGNPVYVVLYVIWLVALWFHLTHGFWSAMQTLGWNGKVWFKRWKTIGNIFVTLLVAGFIVVVLAFAFKCTPSLCKAAKCKAQTECMMQAPCDKAHGDCDKAHAGCDKAKADCCKEKADCPKAQAER
ncbi:MAG: succinate dehydrogenase/fumarate reductase cytochrome b subunit [Prevotella sp.]|nr:succinate dehydrogenase/fumarate reductase cytochrome b subunit [Prevotella sp.]